MASVDQNRKASKLTWKEFKQLCEQQGVLDNDELDIIDVSWGSVEYFEAKKDEDFGWQITLRGI
ncbi:MAG: hypothetical protein LJE85_02930 [Gammaproteobacteria bacterium]|jgi:hypothetical protein|nr:hypothetical protein [Gammaproteobacteria bacterium]